MRVVALALALMLGSAITTEAETFKVVVPQKGNWDSCFVEFGVRQGYFRDEGIEVEPIYTEGGAVLEQAIASGSADIGWAAGLLGVVAAYQRGMPMRVVSAEATGAGDLYWYAKTESGIKSLKDAGGKTIAFSSPGTASNLVLMGLLKQAGVAAKPVQTGGIPGTFTQLMSGQIDIGWAVPPTALPEMDAGKIVIVARGNDVPEIRGQTIRVNAVGAPVLEKRRDAVLRFFRAADKAIAWAYSDPRAIDLFAEIINVPRAEAAEAVKFYPRESFVSHEIKGFERTLQDAYEAKRIPRPMKPEEFAGLFVRLD